MNEWIWLIFFILFLGVEVLTMGLTTVWFAGGALVAFFVNLAGGSTFMQVVVFLIVSTLLILVTRPLAIKYLNKNTEKTNVERLIGREAIVKEEINALNATGKVMLDGMEWSAKAKDINKVYSLEQLIIVEEIQGVKLVVKGKEDE